tara:strand:- start:739 stop:978 length:240 start_codon:yes stop_codon:yes gene_type:complete
MHVLLLQLDRKGGLVSGTYFFSKFNKKLGDKMSMDGRKYQVGAIADSKEEILEFKQQLFESYLAKQNALEKQRWEDMLK